MGFGLPRLEVGFLVLGLGPTYLPSCHSYLHDSSNPPTRTWLSGPTSPPFLVGSPIVALIQVCTLGRHYDVPLASGEWKRTLKHWITV